jgi:hypothetical protein
MEYRATLEAVAETVQDLELSAPRRLQEAMVLLLAGKNHTAIYIAGLAAEMYLKTACFFLGGASPATRTDTMLSPVRPRIYSPPFTADFESGHGLWFWSQELIARRKARKLGTAPNRFKQICATLYLNWYIGMRYRPGVATQGNAERFLTSVEWLANNHAMLRR